MPDKNFKPTVLVFAGPNGSGKSTITKYVEIISPYINADDVKKSNQCTDLEAAVKAEELREKALAENSNFTFETVLSTERNLNLLRKAKEKGYFIKCIYVLTVDPKINVVRVKSRFAAGGHDVPEEKIISRYGKSLSLIPELIEICDIFHLYDNSLKAFRIFKKRKTEFFYEENQFWNLKQIKKLTGVENLSYRELN
jgi:predicted ABC-type ATPase